MERKCRARNAEPWRESGNSKNGKLAGTAVVVLTRDFSPEKTLNEKIAIHTCTKAAIQELVVLMECVTIDSVKSYVALRSVHTQWKPYTPSICERSREYTSTLDYT